MVEVPRYALVSFDVQEKFLNVSLFLSNLGKSYNVRRYMTVCLVSLQGQQLRQ